MSLSAQGQSWILRPGSLLRRERDQTYWTAGHPGYCDLRGGWHFWRLTELPIGWWLDKNRVLKIGVEETWPDDLNVIRYR